jgi:hypothetical protein
MRDEYKNAIGASMGYAGMATNQACEARQSAKSRMRQQAMTMRREADRMDALADALPEVLTEPADSALWDLLNRR